MKRNTTALAKKLKWDHTRTKKGSMSGSSTRFVSLTVSSSWPHPSITSLTILTTATWGIPGKNLKRIRTASQEKVSIPMTTWPALKDSKKLSCLPKKRFIRNSMTHSSLMKIMNTRRGSGNNSGWKPWEITTLFYLKSDVLLLADVFEEFRNVCLRNCNLDPAWYYTTPGLAWDAALKVSQVGLELLTDVDLLFMIEKGSRGGISMILKRYGKANNKCMGEGYSRSKPRKLIQYLDASNLYGWAIFEPLPVGGFKWMTEEEMKNWKKFLASWNWTWSIQRDFMIFTMIIHWLLRGWRWTEWKADSKSQWQGSVCHSASKLEAVHRSQNDVNKDVPWNPIRWEAVVEYKTQEEHGAQEGNEEQFWKIFLQVDEQLGIRKDHEDH